MTTHSSILAWEIPQTEEPGGLQTMGSQRVEHNLVTKQQHIYRTKHTHVCGTKSLCRTPKTSTAFYTSYPSMEEKKERKEEKGDVDLTEQSLQDSRRGDPVPRRPLAMHPQGCFLYPGPSSQHPVKNKATLGVFSGRQPPRFSLSLAFLLKWAGECPGTMRWPQGSEDVHPLRTQESAQETARGHQLRVGAGKTV